MQSIRCFFYSGCCCCYCLPSCSYDKSQFGLSGHIKVFAFTSDTSQTDQVLLFLLVFADILFGSLEYVTACLLLLLFVEDESARSCCSSLGVLFTLFQQGLGHLWQLTWRLSFAIENNQRLKNIRSSI